MGGKEDEAAAVSSNKMDTGVDAEEPGVFMDVAEEIHVFPQAKHHPPSSSTALSGSSASVMISDGIVTEDTARLFTSSPIGGIEEEKEHEQIKPLSLSSSSEAKAEATMESDDPFEDASEIEALVVKGLVDLSTGARDVVDR